MPKNLSELIADDLTGHTLDLTRVSEGVLREKILGNFKVLEESLIQDIERLSTAKTQMGQLARLQKLQDSVTRTIKEAYTANAKGLRDSMTELAELEANYAKVSMNDRLGVELMSATPAPATVKALARDTLIEGAPSKEWWSRQATKTRKAFEDQMTQGILRGESTQALVQRVRGTATGNRISYEYKGKMRSFPEFEGGILSTSTREATALVRTSVQNVANSARLETYKANSDIISAVQALVSLDSRTTHLCQARSGMIWDLETGRGIDGTPEDFPGPPPWHFNCRSTLVPVTRSWEELSGKKGVPELPLSTQSSMDGQVAGNLTYESWLKSKPKSFQREVLGKSRFKMFNEGKLTLRELIDSQTAKPLTVSQLMLKLEPGSTERIVRRSVPRMKPVGDNKDTLEKQYKSIVNHKASNKINDAMLKQQRRDPFATTIPTSLKRKVRKLINDEDFLAFVEEFKLGKNINANFAKRAIAFKNGEADRIIEEISKIWGSSATKPISIALQQALKAELGLDDAVIVHMKNTIGMRKVLRVFKNNPKAAAGARKLVRVLYDDTQEYLAKEGVKDLYVYRGQVYKKPPKELLDRINESGGRSRNPSFMMEIDQQPITSWTLRPHETFLFAGGQMVKKLPEDAVSAIFGTKIPAKRIFSLSHRGLGLPHQGEVLLVGGRDVVSLKMFSDVRRLKNDVYFDFDNRESAVEELLKSLIEGKANGP